LRLYTTPSDTWLPLGMRVALLRPTGSLKTPSSEETAEGAVGIEQPAKRAAIVNVLTNASFMVFLQ
jgi:hypothetical protein